MKLDLHEAEAIVRLQNQPEFKVFLDKLMVYAENLNERLIMTDNVSVDLARGELRAYSRITRLIADAPNVIAAYNRPKE